MITVLTETEGDQIIDTSWEALTFARMLAERRGSGVSAVVIGAKDVATGRADQLGQYGATEIRAVTGQDTQTFSASAYAGALLAAAEASASDAVVTAGTARGNEIAAHVACRLDAVMAANVVAIEDDGPLVVSRQVMGGGVLEDMQVDSATAVLTVAGHAVEAQPADTPASPGVETVEYQAAPAELVTAMKRLEPTEQADTEALTSARVVIGAGRGVGSAGAFDDVEELAELLDGALGVSRVVTNLGWRPHQEQVGQTGSRISPDLYVACGISGAIQHMAGIQSARTIAAINTDQDAPMVQAANYAIIGDMHEIVPAINEELRRRRG